MSKSAGGVVDLAQAQIGLVCSLPLEINEFLGRCQRVKTYGGGDFKFYGGLYDDIRIAVVLAGTGPKRAQRATNAMLDAHRPNWIVSTGFAGALRPELKIGHIVVANDIVGTSGERLSIDLVMPSDESRGLHVGRTLTVDHMVRTITEKQTLESETKAVAVDMESLAVASVCRQRETRFMAVRAISDDMSADLPSEVYGLVGETGAVRFGAVIGSLWKRPSSLKDMWHLRENAISAGTRLADFLDGIIVQLHKSIE